MAEPGFLPRKEFLRENKPTRNVFALLAVAGANFLRLYSFTSTVVNALRRLLETQGLLVSFKEHSSGGLFEFTLEGKPWANSKSVATEKLLLDLLAIIYDTGYALVSTLDYGRESDDRLAIAFSRLENTSSTSRVGTPVPTGTLQQGDVGAHHSSERVPQAANRTPFALSFASTTCMRVIAPPLHLTPAILQAVRSSWPRGVVSEKKVGDNSFEFKLKGYKWFQQDTFAADSLRHILSLLTLLDAQSFTLVSSISLTGRSKVKDLWIFTGPGTQLSSSDDLSRYDSPAHLHEAARQRTQSPNPSPHLGTHVPHYVAQHRRLVSEPAAPMPHDMQGASHTRAATDQPMNTPGSPSNTNSPASPRFGAGFFRKPAPRAQIPVSVVGEVDETEQVRAAMPSIISSNAEDMTGVGATGYASEVFYSTPPPGGSTTPIQPFHEHTSATRPPRAMRPVSTRAKTPPPLVSSPPVNSSPRPQHHIPAALASSSPPRTPPANNAIPPRWVAGNSPPGTPPVGSGPPKWDAAERPPLLGSGAFGDSAFSGSSETGSSEVPIKWTGFGEEGEQISRENSMKRRPSTGRRKSSGDPKLPGAWAATPIEEKPEGTSPATPEADTNALPFGPQPDSGIKTPVLEVASRVSSPEVANGLARKSEAALVDMITDSASVPPVPELPQSLQSPDSPGTPGGHGWVLVNVAATGTEANIGAPPSLKRRDTASSTPRPPPTPSNGVSNLQGTVSPQAKAIAIQDAIASKKENKPPSKQGSMDSSNSVKKFFSLNRKGSKKLPSASSAKDDDGHKPKAGFRDRLRLIGMTEASRNEGKRRSID